MSFANDPSESSIAYADKKTGQKRCLGRKYLPDSGMDISRGNGDWMLTSKHIRQLIGKNLKIAQKVSDGKPKKYKP